MNFDSIKRKIISILVKVVYSVISFFALFSRPHIKVPLFLKDKKLTLMGQFFEKEKWIMLESNLKQLDQQERCIFLQEIANNGKNETKFNNWVNTRKGNELSLLAKAYHHIAKGWEYRGGGLASIISNKSWELFYHELGKSIAALNIVKNKDEYSLDVAIALLDMSQTSALSEQEQLWAQQILQEKGSHIVLAHLGVLNSLTPKWGGSIEQMNNYIDQQKGDIKVYSALIASKHIELWLNIDLDIEDDFPNPYFKKQSHLEEITKVFIKYTNSFENSTLIDFIILNYYTVAFYIAKEYNYASQCMKNLEGRFVDHPWVYLGDSLLESYDVNRVVSRISKELT